ncbi:hypothetical protein [Ruegeria arenilitoris]|uniref:hypothetical protein n=1 Tax=Ruegeria arenilitoris TaxID=1173585 RepID=UPI00147E7A49|nr:hypothetical protein [Ruegeria arenilitoris]
MTPTKDTTIWSMIFAALCMFLCGLADIDHVRSDRLPIPERKRPRHHVGRGLKSQMIAGLGSCFRALAAVILKDRTANGQVVGQIRAFDEEGHDMLFGRQDERHVVQARKHLSIPGRVTEFDRSLLLAFKPRQPVLGSINIRYAHKLALLSHSASCQVCDQCGDHPFLHFDFQFLCPQLGRVSGIGVVVRAQRYF